MRCTYHRAWRPTSMYLRFSANHLIPLVVACVDCGMLAWAEDIREGKWE